MKTLPVYDKGVLVTHAFVDDDVHDRLCRFLWKQNADGYIYRASNLYLHHEILKPEEGFEVDHRNQCKLDCRRQNLRATDRRFQNLNLPVRGRVRVRGVRRTKSGKFVTRIWLEGRDHDIGTFHSQIDAARARDAYNHFLYGDWVEPNRPDLPILLLDAVESLRVRRRGSLPLYVRKADLLERVRRDATERMKIFKEVEERGWVRSEEETRKAA